jgi:hypothetical protein
MESFSLRIALSSVSPLLDHLRYSLDFQTYGETKKIGLQMLRSNHVLLFNWFLSSYSMLIAQSRANPQKISNDMNNDSERNTYEPA